MYARIKEHNAADRFCREHDELRNFLRSRSHHNQYVRELLPADAVAFSITPASRWASCRSHNQNIRAARCIAKGASRDRTELPVAEGRRSVGVGPEDRPLARPAQFQAEGGTGISSAGTSVFTETCGQVRPLKFRKTSCEY